MFFICTDTIVTPIASLSEFEDMSVSSDPSRFCDARSSPTCCSKFLYSGVFRRDLMALCDLDWQELN
jgi:hypothetical protein